MLKFHGVVKLMLIKKGAEASLYLEEWHGQKIILKKRHPKRYRVPELDKAIQVQRTRHEPQIIHKAKEGGVPTPVIYMVDLSEAVITMEFVEGKQVKQVLNDLTWKERKSLCNHIGKLIGKLHLNGIIHGDLTTSNMILTPSGKVVFIDFGLSEQTVELEARGVDLHLMKQAIASTHYMHVDECLEAVIAGYRVIMGEKTTEEVLVKVAEIEKRGRYVSER
jgi:TP53 regulating kinase-like protein